MIQYYSNDDKPDMVIRYTEPSTIHVIRNGDIDWVKLPQDNSYIREISCGQGNNCMTKITPQEAKKTVKRILKNGIYRADEKSIETLF